MKKVLLISYHFPPKIGGLENLIFNTWKSLNKKHEVLALVPYTANKDDSPAGVFRSPVPGLLFYFLFVFLKGFWLMAKHNCDVVLSGSGLTSYLAIILAKLFRAASVTIVLGLDITYPHPLYRAMISFFLHRNDAVVSISDSTTAKAVSVGVCPDIITKIHPGVDYGSFQIGKSQEELKIKYGLEGRRVILNAGRLAKRKGALEFVRYCMPSIVKEVPDAMFLLVGANPTQSLAHRENMAVVVQTEINKLGLEKHVRMVGMVDQESLVEYYNLCDIFVLPVVPVPGDAEGFGIVCIEASSAGKPVVGTDIGGIPDSVENGKSGVLLPPNDHEGLACEIISLLNDPQKRGRMGEYGKNRVRDGFDWGIVGNQYVELLEGLG
jgi:phosphatidyl-myo-inositol dimannoside synthase